MAKIILTVDVENKKAIKGVGELESKIQGLSEALSEIKVNKDLTAQINSLSKYYTSLSNAYAKTTVNANKQAIADEKLALAKEKMATQTAKTSTELAKEKLTLEKVNTEIAKQSTELSKQEKTQKSTAVSTQSLQKKYADLLSTLNSLEKNYKKGTFDALKASVQANLTTVKQNADEYERLSKVYGPLSEKQLAIVNSVANADKAYEGLSTQIATTRAESKSLHGTLQDVVGGFLKFQLSAMLVMKPLQMIRSAISSINETLVKTEDTIIAFQRVVGKNISGETISSELYGLAQQYGQTFDNVQSIALDFARTGLSWADTIKATEAALLGLNTAELSADDAAQGLIAVLQQFKLDASELESVIDKLNITQDNAAVTTDKLLTALQRTGSSAKNANLSLEETVALITALSSATGRSGENLGTAINSLIQYSSKESALNIFAGLSDNTEEVVGRYRKGAATILEVWQAVSTEIQHLTEQQADLLDSYFETEDGSAFKDAMADDLEEMYDELAGVYTTANTFRKNYFIALLGNMDEVEEALGRMDEAEGYSQNQNIDYLTSYTAMQNTIKAQWEELASGESGWVEFKKGLIEAGVVVLDIVKGLGGLSSTLIYLSSAVLLVTSSIKVMTGGINPLAKIILSLSSGVQNLITRIKSLGGAGANIKSAFTGWSKVIKDISTYLKANADAQKAAKVAQDALNTSIKINADENATAEAKQEAATFATETKVAADAAATASTEALSVAMATLGAVINIVMIAITAAIIVIQAFVQGINKQKQAEEENTKALQDSAKALTEETNALYDDNEALLENIRLLDIYIKKIKDATSSNEDRTDALSEIQSIYADLLSNYGIENDKIMLLTTSYEGLNEALEEYLATAKEVAAQQAQTALDKGEKALNDAEAAQVGASAKITLSGHYNTRYGFIEAGLEDLLSDYTRGKGINLYGTDILTFDATEESLRVLEEAKEKLLERYNSTSGTNQMQARKALAEVTKAIDTISEALNITAEAQEVYDKAWTQNELLNTELAEYFYAAQGTTQENYDALVKLLYIINSNVEYTEKERKALKTLIQNELKDYLGKYDAILNTTDEWHNDITKVTGKYEDLIATLEELRDLQQESYDWEEKKLAVLEAEKALEDARNQATVRRYNSATSQWEWQTDEKAIKEAEDSLEKARLDLEQETYDKIIELLEDSVATNEGIEAVLKEVAPYLGEQIAQAFRDTIKDQTGVNVAENPNEITSTTTNTDYLDNLFTEAKTDLEKAIEGIQILEGASGSGIAAGRVGDNGEVKWNGKTYKIENAGAISNDDIIAQAAIGEGGLGLSDRTIFAYKGELYGYLDGRIVKLQRRANSYGDNSDSGYKALSNAVTEAYGSYDSGGIANGLGYMAKATTQPETVNGPDLTAQILSPQSNKEWETYARTMGIMFEQAHNFASRPIIERVGGNTDNSVNNSGQVIMNGVAIGSDKRENSFNDVLRMVGLVNN